MRKAQVLYVAAPLLTALVIRLYPTLVSGMPFSTDAWPLIKNAETLTQHSPIALNSPLLDSYNSFWPTISTYGAILAEVLGVSAINSMAIGVPIAAALAIPIFYIFTKKLTQNSKIAVAAAVLLATAFPYTLFTAGVTKETFASPIYITLILLFLLKHNWKTTTLFTLLSIALVLTHHLTAFLTVGILAAITIARYIGKDNQRKINTTTSNTILTAILTAATALYIGIYSINSLSVAITVSDILSVGAYQLALIAATVYILSVTTKKSSKQTIYQFIAALLVIIGIIVVSTNISLLPTAPVIPTYYLVFGLPFIIALPIITIALSKLYRKKTALLTPLLWLIPILAFASYGIFANPATGLSFAVRSVNFLLPPLMILVAIGLYKLTKTTSHPKTGALTKLIAIAVIVTMVAVNVNTLYATVTLQEPYLGYFWRYEPPEYQASNWLANNTTNQTVAGDSKVHYLTDQYFNQNVSITQGLNYLQGNASAPKILFIYNQMYTNGYVLYQGIPIELPSKWTEKLAAQNCIYDNSEVRLYARG